MCIRDRSNLVLLSSRFLNMERENGCITVKYYCETNMGCLLYTSILVEPVGRVGEFPGRFPCRLAVSDGVVAVTVGGGAQGSAGELVSAVVAEAVAVCLSLIHISVYAACLHPEREQALFHPRREA